MTARAVISFVVLCLSYALIAVIFDKGASSGNNIKREYDEALIKETVLFYNKAISDIYTSGGVPAMLNELPSSKQLKHELFKDVNYFYSKGAVIVYDMAGLVFKDIKLTSPNTAEAITFEEWNYVTQKIKTREMLRIPKGMDAGFRYFLVRDKGGWLIVDYIPADVKYEETDKYYY